MIPIGIKDESTISVDMKLGDLGLDSLMSVEVQQTLQRQYDISMPTKEIRELTFDKLDQLSGSVLVPAALPTSEAVTPLSSVNTQLYDLHHLFPTESVVEMNRVETEAAPLFVIHPIEGSVFVLDSIMSKIQSTKVYGIQCTDDTPLISIPGLASHYMQVIECVVFSVLLMKLVFILELQCHIVSHQERHSVRPQRKFSSENCGNQHIFEHGKSQLSNTRATLELVISSRFILFC